MKLLILGSTVFLGRHVVQAALARGHDVAILTRGRHGRGLFPQVDRLVGDRDADLGALRGRRFGWMDDAALLARGVAPWTGLPLRLPETDPSSGGMMLADLARARAAGRATRPARETIADTLAWLREPPEPAADASRPVATLTPERGAECLAAIGVR